MFANGFEASDNAGKNRYGGRTRTCLAVAFAPEPLHDNTGGTVRRECWRLRRGYGTEKT